MFQKFKCKAKVKTVIDKIVVSIQEHNHLADAATVEAIKVFENPNIISENVIILAKFAYFIIENNICLNFVMYIHG